MVEAAISALHNPSIAASSVECEEESLIAKCDRNVENSAIYSGRDRYVTVTTSTVEGTRRWVRRSTIKWKNVGVSLGSVRQCEDNNSESCKDIHAGQ